MNKLKVCFIGVGSIAKRHIVNLNAICKQQDIKLTIDVCRSSVRKLPDEIIEIVAESYYGIDSLPSDYDVAFITNPTQYHMETLRQIHSKAKHFFIEKPITSYEKITDAYDFPVRKESIYYVACPLRYTKVIQYIKNNLNMEDVISARCISSSYLPDWRPRIDYRDTYSARKDLGGGVSIDLIHEWDYICYLFGTPQKILSLLGKQSDLEIDCDDYAAYIVKFSNKVVELHLDYFGRKTIREMMLFTKKDTIIADLAGSKITFLKTGKVLYMEEERDVYQRRELLSFLEMIDSKTQNENSIETAIQTLKYTQGVVN